MVTLSFINQFDGTSVPDGLTVKLFNVGDDVTSATPIDTKTTTGGKIKSSALLVGHQYQFVLSGTGTPTSNAHTFLVRDILTAASIFSDVAASSGGGGGPVYSDMFNISGNSSTLTSGGVLAGAGLTFAGEGLSASPLTFSMNVTTGTITVTPPPLPSGFDYWKQEIDMNLNGKAAATGVQTKFSIGWVDSSQLIDFNGFPQDLYPTSLTDTLSLSCRAVMYFKSGTTAKIALNVKNLSQTNVSIVVGSSLVPCKLQSGQTLP